ncbi:MAG TPA: M20/M25/M40 family metallo-hydrolase [Thermoanaerobaculia bacterium]|nr:M20/M25/M40 family metallo-hydrolase [Thermoanaerobaculia bacterium]
MNRTLAALLLLLAPLTFAQQRPDLKLTTTESFDAASIRPYRGRHQKIYDYIDARQAEHLAAIQRWVRQRSISALNEGVTDMATMLRDDLRRIGFKDAELVPTSGHPGVVGFYDAGAKKTLAVYMMYDVQPVEAEGWKVEAFDGVLVDHDLGRALMARGATNQKGPERSFLNALESIIAVEGKLPVNLLVIAEGEEELGSPHFPEVVAKVEERLRQVSGVLFPMFGQDRQGNVTVNLGVKGIVYFEMEAKGGERGGPVGAEVHGSTKAIIDSPAWRLVQALASLTSEDGNTIVVPGYYDSIRPPTVEEQRVINSMLREWSSREPSMKEALDVRRWANGWTGEQLLLHYLFDTTLNIDGIWSGYTGPGVKTILPHKATAKVDSRLVPDQTPEEALRLIRQHLDRQGFTDIEIRLMGGYPPAQTSASAPLVQQAISVYNKYGLTPALTPRLAGSAPYYVFTRLGLPLLAAGIGHGSGAHAPNEYMLVNPKEGSRIANLPTIEKFYVDLLYALR